MQPGRDRALHYIPFQLTSSHFVPVTLNVSQAPTLCLKVASIKLEREGV